MASTQDSQGIHRRKQKFIRPDVQLKVVFITLFVTCTALLINARFVLGGLEELSLNLREGLGLGEIMAIAERATYRGLLVALLVTVPVAIITGVLYSFRFAGPIHGLHMYFERLRDGAWDRPCALRRGDDLQDVAETVNQAMGVLRGRMQADRELMAETRRLLNSAVMSMDEASGQALTDIQGRLEEAERAHAERFPIDPSDAEGIHPPGSLTVPTESDVEAQRPSSVTSG